MKKHWVTVAAFLGILVVILAGLAIMGSSGSNQSGYDLPVLRSRAEAEALRQAEQFKPKGICTMAITPAVHDKTGVRYTFSSGCLPEGWRPEYTLTQ